METGIKAINPGSGSVGNQGVGHLPGVHTGKLGQVWLYLHGEKIQGFVLWLGGAMEATKQGIFNPRPCLTYDQQVSKP